MVVLIASGCVVMLIVYICLRYYIKNRWRSALSTHANRLKTGTEIYAWYDPSFDMEWGHSIYEMEDGSKRKVTFVSSWRGNMKGRKCGKAVYLGHAKKFIAQGSCPLRGAEFSFDTSNFVGYLEDIALLCYLYPPFWTENYPIDEMNPDFDPPEASEAMLADLSTSVEEERYAGHQVHDIQVHDIQVHDTVGGLQEAEPVEAGLPSTKPDEVDTTIHAVEVESPTETIEIETPKSTYSEPVATESYDSGSSYGSGDSGGDSGGDD